MQIHSRRPKPTIISEELLEELSCQSYRNVHSAEAQAKILENFGVDHFRKKGVEFHGGILAHAFQALEDMGYMIVTGGVDFALGPDRHVETTVTEQDYSDLC